MMLLIGIDDTDNKESRGTGYKSRQLASGLEMSKLATVKGITRHQLFVHDDIAYTSQNSSACLEVESENRKGVLEYCRNFLIREAAEGSDAGLCIAEKNQVPDAVINWGQRAKKEVLSLGDAIKIAQSCGIFLEGYTGTKIGQIGALAAVGLRKGGNDGRFIWLFGTGELRDFDSGVYTVGQLCRDAGINSVQSEKGKVIPDTESVFCEGWTRPILFNNMSVLLVEKINFADYGWKTISKEYIRNLL